MESQDKPSCVDTFRDICRGLSHKTNIQRTLEELCARVNAFFAPLHLAFLLVDPENGDLTFAHVLGDKVDLLSGKKLRKGKGLAGWVAERGEPLFIANTADDPRFPSQFLTAKTKDSKSILAVPIWSGEAVFGVLELIDTKNGQSFSKENLRDLTAMGELITLVLERAYFYQAMKRMSETDPLTGLANKRAFDAQLEREIEVCKRYGTPACVLNLSLANLRKLNEEHGAKSIDRLLILVAKVLAEESRKVDLACRVAADKFSVIMPNTLQQAAQDVSRRINARIAQEGASQELPYFTLNMTVLAAVQQDLTPLLGLCDACRLDVAGFRKIRDVASNIYQLLNEEKQAMERRRYYRKNVQLAGRFENPETGESGDFLVENLSLNGLGFSTLINNRLDKNAVIKIGFRLDDSRRTEIVRLVRVRYVIDRYVGCQFSDQKSFDGDLGFYLMR